MFISQSECLPGCFIAGSSLIQGPFQVKAQFSSKIAGKQEAHSINFKINKSQLQHYINCQLFLPNEVREIIFKSLFLSQAQRLNLKEVRIDNLLKADCVLRIVSSVFSMLFLTGFFLFIGKHSIILKSQAFKNRKSFNHQTITLSQF